MRIRIFLVPLVAASIWLLGSCDDDPQKSYDKGYAVGSAIGTLLSSKGTPTGQRACGGCSSLTARLMGTWKSETDARILTFKADGVGVMQTLSGEAALRFDFCWGLNEESIAIAYRENEAVKTMRGVFVEGRLTLEGKSYSRGI